VNPLYLPIGDEAFVRTFALDDAETLFSLVDAERERLRRWMPWTDGVRTVEDQRGWIQRALASEHDHEANGIWLSTGELAGTIGMTVTTLENRAEVGYWIAERYEGRGLVSRAAAAMIDLGFRELRLHRITLRAAVTNARSRAVAERLGFTREGVLREQGLVCTGQYHDMVVYGLLDREWKGPP
jgi:ribosomal-protein-serine acetyltransferase